MVFEVNPEKKRTWNHGWWKDWTQGKVLIGVSLASVVVFVAAAVHAALTVDFGALIEDPGSSASSAQVAPALAHVFLLSLSVVGMCLGLSVLRHRSEPERATSAESLIIEDGWLVLRMHNRGDVSPRGQDIVAARLDGCAWWWDARRRQLVVDAVRTGALRAWGYVDPSSEPEVSFEQMEPVDVLRFYPFYDPDPIAYLREIGAPERPARSARWEM